MIRFARRQYLIRSVAALGSMLGCSLLGLAGSTAAAARAGHQSLPYRRLRPCSVPIRVLYGLYTGLVYSPNAPWAMHAA